MLRKKEIFTVITPIPSFIPRQLAVDILHSHSEVITLNPLVVDHRPVPAPRDAQADEYYSTWYEISQRIQFVPGLVKFNGCFHDMPWGLQTHVYVKHALMNVDLRNKYRIAGNQPGVERPEAREIGLKALGAPADGLYLREDIEIKCNVAVVSFVKAELQRAGGEMVSRMIRKAELLDAGVLHAMIEDGRLKTVNPADRSTLTKPLPSPTHSPCPQQTPPTPYQVPRPASYSPSPSHHMSGFATPSPRPTSPQPPLSFSAELPGDYYYSQPAPQPSAEAAARQSHRDSSTSTATTNTSYYSPDPSRFTQSSVADSQGRLSSRPTSYSSDATGTSGGFRSPGLEQKGFAAELPTHAETQEEHREEALRKLDPRRNTTPPRPAPYDPRNYAAVSSRGPPPPPPPPQQQQQQQQQQQSYPGHWQWRHRYSR